MATADEILFVRANAAVPDDDPYTDEIIGDMIDTLGVIATIASIWEQKAASAATRVDVTEAGASHKFSNVYKNYIDQAKYWLGKLTVTEDTSGRTKVKKIVRS